MFSDGYKSKYFNQQLRRQSSSGSTGMPVNVYWDYKDWYASNMCLWRKRQAWYGIKPTDKYCIFTLNAFGITPEEGKIYYINEPKNVLSFNTSLIHDGKGFEQVVVLINDFCPDWLYVQPLVLKQLIRAYRNINLEPAKQVKYIESVGEILTSDLRRKTEELFHVKITNMYGSEEMNGIAIENPSGAMHTLTDNVFLEIKNDYGIKPYGEGGSIITNLNNHAMPLIRYEQYDSIVLFDPLVENQTHHTKVIKKIVGRSSDSITLPNGTILNSNILADTISEVNNQINDIILDYLFVYRKESNTLEYTLTIVPQSWEKSVNSLFESTLTSKINPSSNLSLKPVPFTQKATRTGFKKKYLIVM